MRPLSLASPNQIPFGRLLMEHVRERCVLLRACWRVDLGAALLAELTLGREQQAGARARNESSRAHVSPRDEVDVGGEAGDGASCGDVTYARTVSIECDGQVSLPCVVNLCSFGDTVFGKSVLFL